MIWKDLNWIVVYWTLVSRGASLQMQMAKSPCCCSLPTFPATTSPCTASPSTFSRPAATRGSTPSSSSTTRTWGAARSSSGRSPSPATTSGAQPSRWHRHTHTNTHTHAHARFFRLSPPKIETENLPEIWLRFIAKLCRANIFLRKNCWCKFDRASDVSTQYRVFVVLFSLAQSWALAVI